MRKPMWTEAKIHHVLVAKFHHVLGCRFMIAGDIVFYQMSLSQSESTILHKSIIYNNDDQGRIYQNCKFHDPWGKGSCAKVWPYK